MNTIGNDRSNDQVNRFIGPVVFLTQSQQPLVTLSCQFDVVHYVPEYYQALSIQQPVDMIHYVPKRQANFLVGRYVAQQALAQLGYSLSEGCIGIGAGGAPLWPEGFVGSISHSETIAVCSVARKMDYHCIGIDVENWFASELIQTVQHEIINPAEIALLKATSLPYAHMLTVAFSAKESFYKALYPDVRQFFDFSAVDIIDLNMKKKTLTFSLNHTLSSNHRKGHRYLCQITPQVCSVITFVSRKMTSARYY